MRVYFDLLLNLDFGKGIYHLFIKSGQSLGMISE